MSLIEQPLNQGGGIGKIEIKVGGDLVSIFAKGAEQLTNLANKLPRTYSKELQARKGVSTRKSNIPDELGPAYESVEAGLLAVLGMGSSEEAGDQGLTDRGGIDTPFHNLQLLRTRLTNRQITDEFLNSSAMKEYRRDPFARNKVIAALGSLENAFPPINAAS